MTASVIYKTKKRRDNRKVEPGTSVRGTPGRGTPKYLGGTRDLGLQNIHRWDSGPETLKLGPGTRDPKIFKWNPGFPIFYT